MGRWISTSDKKSAMIRAVRLSKTAVLAAVLLSAAACAGDPPLTLSPQDCEIVVEVLPRTTHPCMQYRGARAGFAPAEPPKQALTVFEEPAALTKQLAAFGFAPPPIEFASHVALLVWQQQMPLDAHITNLKLTRVRADGTYGREPEWVFGIIGTQKVSAAGRLEPVDPAFFVSVVPVPREVDKRRTQE